MCGIDEGVAGGGRGRACSVEHYAGTAPRSLPVFPPHSGVECALPSAAASSGARAR